MFSEAPHTPSVILKMHFQKSYGLKLYKEMNQGKRIAELDRELTASQMQHYADHSEDAQPKYDKEKDKIQHKDLFKNSHKQYQFFEVAKNIQKKQSIEDHSAIHTASYMRFFQQCQKTGTLALPIFSKARD